MKIFILLIFAIVGITQRTKADTVDYCHVYYNKTKIKEFNEYSKQAITIKIDGIKSSDSITVKYFKDTHCPDCDTQLTIKDEKHQAVVTCKGKGIGNPLSFALKDLLACKQKSGFNSFEIFYDDIPIAIFSIKLE